MPQSRILVAGATGFIGGHLLRALCRRGLRPRVLVRPTSSRANLAGLDVELIEGDLLDPATLRRALEGCARLCHVAGLVSTAPGDRRRVIDSNVHATELLLDAARQAGIEQVVMLNCISALGASATPTVFPADAPYNLDGTGVAYFEAKRAADQVAERRIAAGLPIARLYAGYCLGPDDVYRSSSRMIEQFVAGQIASVTNAGMAFVDARDVAEALANALECGLPGARYVLAGHNITYQEFFTLLARLSDRPAPRQIVPKLLLRAVCALGERLTDGSAINRATYEFMARYYWYDSAPACAELGVTLRPLEETLGDTLAWLRQAGHIPAAPAPARRGAR